MAMSSASPSPAALLLAALILSTTMAGTRGNVTETVTSINSGSTIVTTTTARSSSSWMAISSSVEVVADQRMSWRNGTDETPKTIDVSTTTSSSIEGLPTAGINSHYVVDRETVTASTDKPATAPRSDNIIQENIGLQNQPHQEQLIGLVDNVTDHYTSETPTTTTTTLSPTAMTTTTNKRNSIFQEAASTTVKAIDTTTTKPIEFSKPMLRTTSVATTRLATAKPASIAPMNSEPGGKSSRTRNELLSGNFHEIKPAQKVITKMAGYFGGKIVKPNVPSALGKYTPYFEDGQEELNMTARIGNTVILDCEIGMLGNKTVTWSHHTVDVIRLLTFGRNAYSVDQRISLSFKYPTNWRLKIQYATPRDSGLYECQVATYPPLVKKIHLLVTAPILVIMDDSGRIKSGERHLKAGSALRLRCEARDIPEQYNETVIWTRGEEILSEDVNENRTVDTLDGREVQVIVITLVIERATPRHAGNYSCVVPEKARATVAVHVLNGELPAAVHDGNGVSRSVFNLWLIHLTVSYVFSR
ncbi:uncharacterized protein LOC106642842 [Copidosoma floridanum]|uniref:uncharacterized protein LOC106642842 n=1 Tax=Copidosoma floridanum TaxID=29053 RepID=UPI0006C97B86|nr:uncharacterized protein LOC106642842 [Copidosoma floridanum]